MVVRDQLERSKAIQRRVGQTFHLALRLLPECINHATHMLYTVFRVVNDPTIPPPDAQRTTLERIRRETLKRQETSDPALDALRDIREQYAILDRNMKTFIAAVEQDVSRTHALTAGIFTNIILSDSCVDSLLCRIADNHTSYLQPGE